MIHPYTTLVMAQRSQTRRPPAARSPQTAEATPSPGVRALALVLVLLAVAAALASTVL